jgi:hypothetical protein
LDMEITLTNFDNCHASRYTLNMIKSFVDRETETFYLTGKSKRLPPYILKRARRKL